MRREVNSMPQGAGATNKQSANWATVLKEREYSAHKKGRSRGQDLGKETNDNSITQWCS